MSIAVFGGTGFIGAQVCKQLVQMGENVICIDYNPIHERIKTISDKITLVSADVTEFDEICEVISQYQVERIIDFAYMLDSESTRRPHKAMKVNVLGTDNVFEAARINGIKRVIWASSIAIYGRQEDKPLTETDPCYPVTVYGASKQIGEFMSQIYNQRYGMEIACIRPAAVYGPGRLTGLSSFISDIVTLPAMGKEAIIPSSPQKKSTFTYVDDMAADFIGLAMAPKLEYTVYNARGWIRTYGDVAEFVKQSIPDAVITFTGTPTYYASQLDGARLEQQLGQPLKYSFEAGITEQIERVRKFGSLG